MAKTALTAPRRPVLGSQFARRLEAYRRAKAAADEAYERTMGPEYRRYQQAIHGLDSTSEAVKSAWGRMRAAEEAQDDLFARQGAAMDRLLLTPAPDRAAIEAKLEIMLAEEVLECGNPGKALAISLLADVRRLDG